MSASNPALARPCPGGAAIRGGWNDGRAERGGELTPPSESRAWGSWLARWWRFFERHHGVSAGIVQAALSALACVAALNLRFDGNPPAAEASRVIRALPFLVLIRAVWLWPFHLYRDAWRYVSLREFASILLSVGLGSATFWLLLIAVPEFRGFPASVILLDGLLCLLSLVGVRVVRRFHHAIRSDLHFSARVLLVGVDDSAEAILRSLTSDPGHGGGFVGLVAEDASSMGLRIHGVPVVGSFDQLQDVLRRSRPDQVLLVASAIPDARRRELIRICRGCGRPVKIVPALDDVLAGRTDALKVEPPELDDLLFREPIPADLGRVRPRLRGRRILVTGAGGSIGSEICRQVAQCDPERLTLFEKHEASLYHIERELRERCPEMALDAVIGDVRDAARVEEVLDQRRPHLIFHAAAYKHVPMMERNPWEAVRTNVLGTKVMAEAAERAGVETFVLISTDKAVEPVSVMGASKRMAELALRGIAAHARARFLTVRFGNVLGSSGSVVPLFREEIERGGPVTVTHEQVTRWFMTVPEAVQLILEAADLGRGGEVFVLDMGKPIRIVDLATSLIRQYGLEPGTDVPLVFTGLRPGERLFEKLFNDHEVVWKTRHPRILMAVETPANGHEAARRAAELRRLMRVVEDAAGEAHPPNLREVLDEVETVCV